MGEVAVADPAALVGVISDQRTDFKIPHRTSCRALGVSEAWFTSGGADRPSRRNARSDGHCWPSGSRTSSTDRAGRSYGSPRITLDVWEEGWQVSQNTVADLMAELGLQGRKPPRRRRSLTRPGKRKTARDLVLRRFDAITPDILWWGDMTEIDTDEGKLYLASVHDAFSRRALGYAMGDRHDTRLVSAKQDRAAQPTSLRNLGIDISGHLSKGCVPCAHTSRSQARCGVTTGAAQHWPSRSAPAAEWQASPRNRAGPRDRSRLDVLRWPDAERSTRPPPRGGRDCLVLDCPAAGET
ncbi:IS3 family transposase [Streptomyces sp. NPDC048417]|uniref:IS3 family transposase n=1 Tax=Streptomyces sp. NPDC048417 TaxID=3155387 RepID=UPI00342E727B